MRLAVIGAGEMGHGIAELAALHGHEVRMRDIKQEFLDRGTERIRWSLGKTVVVVKKDVPGFITTRVLGPYFEEAARIHDEEGVPIETIDAAMRFRAGFPMGPFELADQVGIDVLHHLIENADRPMPRSV